MVSSSDKFLKDFMELSNDERLLRVFGNEICSLNLWILEIKEKDNTSYSLLYGLIIPSTMPIINSGRWSYPQKKFKSLKSEDTSANFRICRIKYYNTGNKISEIIMGLCNGLTLEEACENINIKKPSSYSKLTLANTSEEVSEFFVVRPVIFTEIRDDINILIENRMPLTSPLNNSPSFVGSLFNLDKLRFFKINGVLFESLIMECLLHLKNETGFHFDGSDGPRIGNIEFLCFTAANDFEMPKVLFQAVEEISNPNSPINDKQFKKVKVTVISENQFEGLEILIRCRLRNGEEIVLDECKEFQITNENQISVYFEANENSRQILVTAWKRQEKEEDWELFYENSYVIFREFNIYSGIQVPYGTLESKSLNKIDNSRKNDIKERIEEFKHIRRINYEFFKNNGYEFDPWVPISDNTRTLTKKMFPGKSKGHFFPKGWDGKNHGTLNFIEWLNSLTKKPETGRIVFIDPYFDKFAIGLMTKAEATNIEYFALTSTQLKLKDDEEPNENPNSDMYLEPKRAIDIKKTCRELEPALSSLNFSLYDLRHKNIKKQVFHDRYILIFDRNNEINEGYHLSNSIQNATRKFPLLVTPIPCDLLVQVNKYIDSLILEKSSSYDLIQLFPLDYPNLIKPDEKENVIDFIPYANSFFRSLIKEDNLMMLCDQQLTFYLFTHRFITKDIKFISNDEIYSNFDDFIYYLVNSDSAEFIRLWVALGEWLYHIPNNEIYLQKFNELDTELAEILIEKLNIFIFNAHNNKVVIGSLGINKINNKTRNIVNSLNKNFVEILSGTKNYVEYGLERSGPNNYGIIYGLRILGSLKQDKLIESISEFLDKLSLLNEDEIEFIVRSNILRLILSEIIRNRPNNEKLLVDLLKSDISLLRAIGSQIIIVHTPADKKELNNSFSNLRNLNKSENIHVLAEWVHDLRREYINYRKNGIEQLNSIIFKEMIKLWKLSPYGELRQINKRLSGYKESDWALSTTNDLFYPLIIEKKLKSAHMTKLWFNILFESLSESQEKKSLNFNMPLDGEFTAVLGHLIANIPENERKKYLKKLKELFMKPHIQFLLEPFACSRENLSWLNSLNILLWIQTILHYAILKSDDKKIKMEIKELVGYVDEIWFYAKIDSGKPLKHLLNFASEIKQKVEIEN